MKIYDQLCCRLALLRLLFFLFMFPLYKGGGISAKVDGCSHIHLKER